MHLLFCGSGWLPIVDLIAARLPADATIATWDRSAPLTTAVGDAEILLPSNATITPEVIRRRAPPALDPATRRGHRRYRSLCATTPGGIETVIGLGLTRYTEPRDITELLALQATGSTAAG